tara:strand:+ start:75 stop:281 length:207 start_codon:yes stop_codon:yes gene_type:complete
MEYFESYGINNRVDEQLKALNILVRQGYTVLDLEGNILNKFTIDKKQDSYHDSRPRYDYKRNKDVNYN